MNMLYAEAAAAFKDLTLSGLDDTLKWQDKGAWPNIFRKARFLSSVDHANWTGCAIRSCWRLTSFSAKSTR